MIRAFYWAVALGQNSREWVSKEGRGGLSARTCPDMPGHAQACLNTPDLALTFHPGLFDIGQGAPILSGYFLLNRGDEG